MSLQRASELLADLKQEYEQSIRDRVVSDRLVHYTHEVSERLRSILDRVARAYWEKRIAPALSEADRGRASVYFPIADDQQAFDSIMGRWRWKSVDGLHEPLKQYLVSLQPYSGDNRWLKILNSLAIQSKHIDLVPQTRNEERRTTVRSPDGGQVSWGPGVRFGQGVSVFGVPINPSTQRIVPNSRLTETIEVWSSITIDTFDVDALAFSKLAVSRVSEIADRLRKMVV